MIVKNEAHVLRRSLSSVRPFISSWVIVDTGSTDDTERIAREALEGVPGEFVSRPWRDFATNRNEALELSRTHADYSLVIDADDELVAERGFVLPQLTHDAYTLTVMNRSERFERVHFLKSSTPWRYHGEIHEHLELPANATTQRLDGLVYRIHLMEGGRSRDPDKYLRDALVLERMVARDPTNARNVYYLARTYDSDGDWERALRWYDRRLVLDGDPDEIFLSLHGIASCLFKQGASLEQVIAASERAHAASPKRGEGLFHTAVWCRVRERPDLGLPLAKRAAAMPCPGPEHLHVDVDVYRWRALEELSRLGDAVGDTKTARTADHRLVREGLAPESVLAAARARLGMRTTDPRFERCAPILGRATRHP
jgi:glycosyltransferase involved in cell wall biosynthesis